MLKILKINKKGRLVQLPHHVSYIPADVNCRCRCSTPSDNPVSNFPLISLIAYELIVCVVTGLQNAASSVN